MKKKKKKKLTLIINFSGDKCTVKQIQNKKPSPAWKKLMRIHRRSNGVRKWR